MHAGSLGYLFYIIKQYNEDKFCLVSDTQGILDSISIENNKSFIYFNRISGLIKNNYMISFKDGKWEMDEKIGVNDIPIEILFALDRNKTIEEIEKLVYRMKDSIVIRDEIETHYIKNCIFKDSIQSVFEGNRLSGFKKID